MKVNSSEVNAHFSNFVNMVHHGERIVIMKNSVPLAALVPHQVQVERKLGFFAGQITVPDDFTAEDEQLNEMFDGDSP